MGKRRGYNQIKSDLPPSLHKATSHLWLHLHLLTGGTGSPTQLSAIPKITLKIKQKTMLCRVLEPAGRVVRLCTLQR
jgi:hypothetical protein